jgi:integrase
VRDKHLDYCAREGLQDWIQVDADQVERYGAHLKKRPYADRSIYLELVLVKSVMKWLIGKRLVPESCRFTLKLRKPQGSDTYCYTPQQVRAMLDHCESRVELKWLGYIIMVLALTGLRISELLGLRARDIDLDSGTLHVADERSSIVRQNLGEVRTTKGRRGRRVPIHRELHGIFQRLLNQSTGRLFVGPRGGRLKADTVRRVFVRDVIKPSVISFQRPKETLDSSAGASTDFGISSSHRRSWAARRRARQRTGSAIATHGWSSSTAIYASTTASSNCSRSTFSDLKLTRAVRAAESRSIMQLFQTIMEMRCLPRAGIKGEKRRICPSACLIHWDKSRYSSQHA